MKKELEDKLLQKYPEFFDYLYENRKIYTDDDPIKVAKELLEQKEMVYPIQFGFECGDGWFWLVDQLMSSIQNYCKNNKKPSISVTQIKEKFGGLRFYYDGGNDKINGMVWFAENLSYQICETCGTTNHVGQTTKGWIYTICKDCLEKNSNANSLDWKENE